MTFHILVLGDWRDQTSISKFDAMINAVNNSGAKFCIAVGDYSGCVYNIDKVSSLITIPKYIMPGNHESASCNTGVPAAFNTAGKYYPSIEGTGIQAQFAATCAQKTYPKIVPGSPGIVGQHKSFFNCVGCRYGVNGTDPITAPPNAVLAVCGDSHCPAIGGTSTCIYINESGPMGTPAQGGCGTLNMMSYVEFDDSVTGKLTVRVQRIPAMSAVSRPTTWVKQITVNWNGNPTPTTTYKCSGSPNYTCTAVTDGSGTYATMAECQTACHAPILKWKCSGAPNYVCVQATDGTYDTQAQCQTACQASVTKYKCSGSPNFTCTPVTDGTGTYDTLAQCQAACHDVIPTGDLQSVIQDVTKSMGYKYGLKDSAGNGMDTLKVIQNPNDNTYIGVYHKLVGTQFNVKLAISTNLLTWTYKRDLETSASQPTIIAAPDKSIIVAFEKAGGGHLKFYHYTNVTNLLSGTINKTYETTRSLSNCNEGTPNIYSVTLNSDINNSVIDVGFHYQRNKSGGGCDVDRQARGTLTNFNSWSTRIETDINSAIEPLITTGSIGDRDSIVYKNVTYTLHEAGGGPGSTNFAGWRFFLYNHSSKTAVKLTMKTHGGSIAFANPSCTKLRLPNGNTGIVVTAFLPSEGVKGGDAAGCLLYYMPITDVPPVMKWKCSGSPNFVCVEAVDGTYDTQALCQAVCQPPTVKKFGVYNIAPGTVINNVGIMAILEDNGIFTKDQTCIEVCKRLDLI